MGEQHQLAMNDAEDAGNFTGKLPYSPRKKAALRVSHRGCMLSHIVPNVLLFPGDLNLTLLLPPPLPPPAV